LEILVKNIATSVAIFLLTNFCSAQNLIPNPGFEEVHACPTGLRQLELAKHWYGANAGTPELFHNCGFRAGISPNSGNGMAGVIFLSEASSFVEYLQIELTDSLVTNEEYEFSFYLRLSESSLIGMNKIGAFFSKNGLHRNLWVRFQNRPQVVFEKVADKTESWQKLAARYTAVGGEKFITIGNFFAKHFITEKIVNRAATDRTTYYYVDDFYLGKKPLSAPNEPLSSAAVKWSHVVYFEKDSSSISETELVRLDKFIQQIPLPIFYPIKIEGHTDQDASLEYNLQLSQSRANKVKARMSNFNLQNLYTSWSGEYEIIYHGLEEEGKSKNRRVTITIER